jgi:hypothetical protein
MTWFVLKIYLDLLRVIKKAVVYLHIFYSGESGVLYEL